MSNVVVEALRFVFTERQRYLALIAITISSMVVAPFLYQNVTSFGLLFLWMCFVTLFYIREEPDKSTMQILREVIPDFKDEVKP